jgi:hypothetical protein
MMPFSKVWIRIYWIGNCCCYRCSKEQLPLYQVPGLSKSIYLANVASGPTTMVSFDGGINWNKTHYECDKVCKDICGVSC